MAVGISLLTLVPGLVGGSETYARELVHALADVGRLDYRVFVSRAAPDLDTRLPVRVVRSYPAASSSARRAVAMLAVSASPVRIVRELRPEPLEAMHFPLTTMLPRTELPTVTTVHDLYHEEPLPSLPRVEVAWRKATWRRAFGRATLLIAISDVVKQSLVDRYAVAPEMIRVVHHGVDHARFHPGHEPRQPFLLFPAHNWPNKNHDRLLDAFRVLRQRHPGLRLVLTGRGHEKRRLEPGVEIRGYVPSEELRRLYRTAAALVFPSLYEGFGQPPLEAMASGCPVAAADAGAIPEVCGDAARLFDPTSTASIIEAVEDVLDRGAEFASRGLERAAAFSWERCAREHESVYAELTR